MFKIQNHPSQRISWKQGASHRSNRLGNRDTGYTSTCNLMRESLSSPEHHKEPEGLAHGRLMASPGKKSFLHHSKLILVPLWKKGRAE